MSTDVDTLETFTSQEYKWGFVTDVEAESIAPGLSEDVVRLISEKKGEPEFLLEWRLKAFRRWKEMVEPTWAFVNYPPINYQDIVYYSAPKKSTDPKTLDEVDPEILKTYEKLGIPLEGQKRGSRVGVDAVLQSCSVASTFQE